METQFAKLITYITEPFVVIVLVVFVLILGAPPSEATAGLILVVGGLSLPVIVYLKDYFTKAGMNLDPGRKDRNDLYLAGIFSFSFVSILFGSAIYPSPLWFFLSMIFAVYMALMYLVNLYFDKASFHISTYVFGVVLLTVQVNTALALLLAALPFVIWSRITLHKHTWVEILWGVVVGLVVGMLTWAI